MYTKRMAFSDDVIFEGDTAFEHYMVVDAIYDGRPARLLYSGYRAAVQSALALDEHTDLLFDYNQRFFELVSAINPRSVLIIGGGAYTLPLEIVQQLPHTYVDVVEIDPGLDTIAERFFGLKPDKRLNILHEDGRAYLNSTGKTYDVILIDAFSHTVMPKSLITIEAVKHVYRSLARGGVAAVNIIGT